MRNDNVNEEMIAKAKRYLKDGISQYAIGRLLGVSQYTICRINQGKYDTGKLIIPKKIVNQRYFTHDPYYTL